jgi:hypothetical protein
MPSRAIAGWKSWALAAVVLYAAFSGYKLVHQIATAHAPGCAFYRPVVTDRLLIAHAGGGLPDRMYPNSIEALDRSYARGLRVFEMDFHQLPFGVMRAGHDPFDVLDPREAWLSQVLDWMRRHPDARLLPDMKTDNVAGLKLILAEAPDLRHRITPFVYTKTEYDVVRKLGFGLPIYALFHHEDADWLAFANSHDFQAVALSEEKVSEIPDIRHPVIVYTFDVMMKAPGARGVITNCMEPAPKGAASAG